MVTDGRVDGQANRNGMRGCPPRTSCSTGSMACRESSCATGPWPPKTGSTTAHRPEVGQSLSKTVIAPCTDTPPGPSSEEDQSEPVEQQVPTPRASPPE
jgi:hypothetical protein